MNGTLSHRSFDYWRCWPSLQIKRCAFGLLEARMIRALGRFVGSLSQSSASNLGSATLAACRALLRPPTIVGDQLATPAVAAVAGAARVVSGFGDAARKVLPVVRTAFVSMAFLSTGIISKNTPINTQTTMQGARTCSTTESP